MNMFDAGADGLYIFNPALGEPHWWRKIGEVATIAGKDKLYGIDRFEGADSFNFVSEVPLEADAPVLSSFRVGEDVGAAGAKSLDFSLHLWDHVPGDELSVKLNGATVDGLQPADPDRKPEEGQWLQTAVHGTQVKRGENRFEATVQQRGESASSPVVLDTVQLRVRY